MKPERTSPPSSEPSPNLPDKWVEQPLEWPRAAGQVDALMAAVDIRQKRQSRRRRKLCATAAGALALVAVFFSLHVFRTAPVGSPPAPDTRTIVTTPERRLLPDGTVVELKPGAVLTVNFTAPSAELRGVALERGEVHFQVAKDPDRAFVVTARGVQFRAVGTAFSVGVERAGMVEMLVTEGSVSVEPRADSTGPSDAIAVVGAGQRVTIALESAARPDISTVSASESDAKLVWRIPRLEFNETPLRDVVASIRLHTGGRIRLASAELERVEISGALRADNLEPLLAMLAANHGIVAERLDGGEIVLRSGR